MKESRIIGIVDLYNSPSLGLLTSSRPTGSTSFLGRYAFCDFALSNFTNSGIDNMAILVKDHQRSVMKHLGSMRAWVNNSKRGRLTIMYNEYGIINPSYNTDAANLKENDWLLYDSSADYIVIQSSHIVANVDLRPIVEEHIARGEDITVVYKDIEDTSKEFTKSWLISIDKDGYAKTAKSNNGKEKNAHASMEIAVINRMVLADIINNYQKSHPTYNFKQIIKQVCKEKRYKIHTHEFKGWAKCFDSYEHYCQYCFDMLKYENAHALFDANWPHYTKTHDTAPAIYGESASAKNSFVANGAVIEGSVENSIISRDVKIGKGSVVKNCIILSGTSIGENCVVENALIDKYSIITKGKTLRGRGEYPEYFKQGYIL